MSSPSRQPFECHWRPSGLLLALYLAAQGLALMVVLLSPAPFWLRWVCLSLCLVHALRVLPRSVRLSSPGAWRGLRHDEHGWQLWSAKAGWQAVQLLPDSLALPVVVVLRFRPVGQRLPRSVCIARDALPHDQHRRLRVRLKFSRNRWAAPG
ncbi:protein YgfX [Pseudomonas sp.]|uniref:protein YgfX n=1 Tax=Pseudomonas sp. TaxID=306 RepID=UPI003D0D2D7C